MAIAGFLRMAVALGAVSTLAACSGLPGREAPSCASGTAMQKHELYFGLTRPGGARIEEGQWRDFLATEVTPRFPEGLTVLDARGQWRDRRDGAVIRQPSRVLVLLHPETPEAAKALNGIRTAYRERFEQQSVLLVSAPVCGDF